MSEKRNNKNKTPGKESAASGHSGPMDVRLLEQLVTSAPPKDREIEAERARARAAKRFATA